MVIITGDINVPQREGVIHNGQVWGARTKKKGCYLNIAPEKQKNIAPPHARALYTEGRCLGCFIHNVVVAPGSGILTSQSSPSHHAAEVMAALSR